MVTGGGTSSDDIHHSGFSFGPAMVYTSAGVNRRPECVACSRVTGFVYYASHNGVLVYNPSTTRVIGRLCGQKSLVNCIALEENESEDLVACGSTDTTVRVWRVRSDGSAFLISILSLHSGPVTALALLFLQDSRLELASTSNDSTICLTSIALDQKEGDDGLELKDPHWRQDMGGGVALALQLTRVAGQRDPLLLVAKDDCSVLLLQAGVQVGKLVGHEDWVTCLASKDDKDGGLVLATGSQDSFVRLWRVERRKEEEEEKETEEELAVTEQVVKLGEEEWLVVVESVLAGHEGRVYTVAWGENGELLTASMDRTVVIWQLQDDIWVDTVRLGELGGGGLGFLGACWAPGGRVLGQSWGGALHLWAEKEQVWGSEVVVGGHQGPVVDLAWETNGSYLITVSKDQTARVHAPWVDGNGVWHEVARPQVHGYDLACCASLSQHRLVSGAEEKLLRAFAAPSSFLSNLALVTGRQVGEGHGAVAEGASVPSLGLSNKAVFEENEGREESERHVKDLYPDSYFTKQLSSKPPPEETLVQNTLWPEVHKLYGHGHELFTVAASPDSTMVASACRATDATSARVLIWDPESWSEVGYVEAHSLTVTQLAFSPCSSYLLAVSRDRTWSLHQIKGRGSSLSTSMVARTDKKTSVHTRLIWACAWAPDGKHFLTVSRDRKVVIWGGEGWKPVGDPLTLADSVTAVAVAGKKEGGLLVACGLDSGSVCLVNWSEGSWSKEVDTLELHLATVTRLAFRPNTEENEGHLLASCSADFSTRLTHIAR